MTTATAETARPAAPAKPDKRLIILDAAMKKRQYRADALIEILHTAQSAFGFLEPEILMRVARALKLPPSRVWGVATFYHLFQLKPAGRHVCVVCLGTACYVKGGAALTAAAEQAVGVECGHTTPDGEVSLAAARCVGACGLAPVVVLDGNVLGHQTPEGLAGTLQGLEKGAADHGS